MPSYRRFGCPRVFNRLCRIIRTKRRCIMSPHPSIQPKLLQPTHSQHEAHPSALNSINRHRNSHHLAVLPNSNPTRDQHSKMAQLPNLQNKMTVRLSGTRMTPFGSMDIGKITRASNSRSRASTISRRCEMMTRIGRYRPLDPCCNSIFAGSQNLPSAMTIHLPISWKDSTAMNFRVKCLKPN